MTQTSMPDSVMIVDHYGKRREFEIGKCPYYGIAVKPGYLEETPKRLGSDWIANQLLSGQRLEIHQIGENGTWFVVDMEKLQGEVINLDQLRDLKPDEISLVVASDDSRPMQMVLEAQNYRALQHTRWNPTGVCALVGPNGSGKTTLLTLLEFLRNAYLRDAPSAMDQMGGVHGLRSWASSVDSPVSVGLTVGDMQWQLQLATQGPTLTSKLGESVTCGDEVALSRPALSQRFSYRGMDCPISDTDNRVALRIISDSSVADELRLYVKFLTNIRIYRSYNIWNLQANGSRQGGDLYLHPNGQNVFTVLRNWRDRRDLKPKYQFVVDHLRQAFPDVFADLDFHVAGLTVTVDVIDPATNELCPLALAPDGLIMGLLHLTAIAGATHGSFIAIDDFGNDLHPYAIRQLVRAFRESAEEHDLVVCLASHSPVLLDEFKEQPSSVFVMEHGLENRPVPLTDLFDAEWLSRFSLGRLYEHGEFGGQLRRTVAAR